jgi:hypothetical protein
MAVVVITEIHGATPGDEEQWASRAERIRRQPGFVFQADGAIAGGWRVISVWESREDFQRFYDAEIRPNLPSGSPERDVISELRDVALAEPPSRSKQQPRDSDGGWSNA